MAVETEEQVNRDAVNEVTLRKHNIVELGKFSYDLEEKREQSILSQANQMMTAFSIYSAALLMVLPILIDNTVIPHSQLLIASILLFSPLIVSLVLAVLAQWRFSYQTMKTAQEFQEKIEADAEHYQHQAQYDDQWINQIDAIHISKKNNNDRRVKLIISSMICFLLSVGLLLVFGVLFLYRYGW